jgi:hypothetical protein
MSDDFAGSFDCPAWIQTFAKVRKVDLSLINICNAQSGSSVVVVDADNSVQDAVLQDAASGNTGIPNLMSVTDVRAGTVVTTPSPLPIWMIALAVVGGLLLLGVIVLIVILVVRRRQQYGGSSSARRSSRAVGRASFLTQYVPLHDTEEPLVMQASSLIAFEHHSRRCGRRC